MIKCITDEMFSQFLKENKATKQQVSFNLKGLHFGYFVERKLVGVISIFKGKTTRVKGFLVDKDYQHKGIGSKLLKHVLCDNMSAFATTKSKELFVKNGFKVHNELKNNITFLKR